MPNTHNLFVAQLATDGSLDWAHQYGGVGGESQGTSIAADDTGSSVLDALKLPRGTVETNQTNIIESQTTVRPGDYFTLQVDGKTGRRTAKITIEKDETLSSLALKINNALLFDGKATSVGVSGGQALKIAINPGIQATHIAGAQDFDALAGLGLKPQRLINDSSTNSTSSGSSTTSGPQIVGLGINGGIDLLSKANASHAGVVLQGAMSLIKQAYSTLNNPPQKTAAQPTGPVPAYLQTQLAGYQTALAWFNSLNPPSSG